MGISLILTASVFAALSNFCMRRSIDSGGTTKAFLMIQLSIGFFFAIFLNPVRAHSYEWNVPILLFGILAGLVFGFMMLALGRSLEKGPPGLTFATLNASTVMPGIVMAALFGAALGHPYSAWHAMGSILVLIGLFWAGWGLQGMKDKKSWAFFVGAAFVLHVLFLVFMQIRALVLTSNAFSLSFLSPAQAGSEWFMPMIFLSAAVLQTYVFLRDEKRKPLVAEWAFGAIGGVANSTCTFFLIWATVAATPIERAMIFPIFSVMIIVLCNLWGRYLYEENVNWRASQVCIAGLIIGTADWKTIASALGF